MTDSNYQRRKDAYLELLDLDDAARAARLAQWEQADPELAAALRAQLEAAAQASPLLDTPARTGVAPRLAQYRVLRELGRGGMGRVWLAERTLGDAVQQVAIKQIVHATWTAEDGRRFERERRIVAGLRHPHIAQLLDGGTDADGAPWFATAYVDGERLDRHIAQRQPNLAERVRLLVKVARAVAHAHRCLVVHRDLKPANILVDRNDEPQLLDFGVARLLAEDAITTTGSSQMTLRYAAPEQVSGAVGEVGVGGDVYALGVLLYESVAEASPYGDAYEAAALVAAILHHEPLPPSACGRVAGLDANLDAIVLKALRKQPEARYPGADALADDLERWLAHEPVEARRGERGYRLRTFVRRRWPWLLLLGAALAGGVGFVLYDRARSRQELAALTLERDKARAVAHYLTELFASATPNEVSEGKLSARELLQRSVARLGEGDTATMSDDARATMYSVAGGLMLRQRLLDEAATMYDRAIALWRTLPTPPAGDLTSTLNDRASVAYQQGKLDQALDFERQALAVRDAIGDHDSTDRGHLLAMLALYQRMNGEREAAVDTLRQAASMLRARLPEGRRYYASALGNLASFTLYDGQPAQALEHAREGRAQVAQLKPERVSTVLNLQRVEASALRELDRLDEALALYRQAIERARRELDRHDSVLAELLSAQAQALLLQQRWDEAEAALQEAESIHGYLGGERQPRRLSAHADRARIRIARERWDEAIAMLEAVRALRPRDVGSERSAAAAEAVQLAYARCRAAPGAAHAQALREAMPALRHDPPLPRVRLAQAEQWLRDCEQRARPSP